MVVQASILMNRCLFYFPRLAILAISSRLERSAESSRMRRRVDSNASPSRLVVGIGVDSNAPPTRLNHFAESTSCRYRSRLRDVVESTRGSVGVESAKSSTPQHAFPYPKPCGLAPKSAILSTQNSHTFDP